ncbi:DUF2283 domain-containing protein [Sphaerisporangium album]|uniref:DUF2283 domain-containing protein n=1 Tax=Sphaerisporangium album TaxID=509200 RepID=A0A367FR06_9ACTN|nr:DUF2283 domain-containing protein [Sphaerisporangium album]RCG32282.1 DUF2283 domain-containing protein [Sphaerisporangium album]
MKVTYDREVDAAYIELVETGPGEAVEQRVFEIPPETEMILDLDRNGFLLGVELLGASKVLRSELLARGEEELDRETP